MARKLAAEAVEAGGAMREAVPVLRDLFAELAGNRVWRSPARFGTSNADCGPRTDWSVPSRWLCKSAESRRSGARGRI
ncbi:MAG: hypothetical protein OXI87_10970 [Albidovulum sp.]|nr:hypothetical protein [Albidovulum sp.]MDE0305384.1 hypothetical protein [Albidovulum sp.]MDE0534617.1 hypothetical protein [Albidovulum sp.]